MFEGYGDTAETRNANAHRAEDNDFITSQTVNDLELKCKVDVAQLYNRTFVSGSFNSGRRGAVQVSETHAYITLTQMFPPFESRIISISRETCEIDAVVDINDINTEAIKIIALKYPAEYNQVLVDAFERSPTDRLCFSPIVLSGDRIITGDGCINRNLVSSFYQDSLPQANGGPVLGKSYGVTNDERHLLAGNIYILDAATLELLDADRVADAGEAEAFGNTNVFGVVGVPQVVIDDEVDEATYIFVGAHSPNIRLLYTRLDFVLDRAEIGKLNGNRPVNRHAFKRFRLFDNGTIAENWRVYDVPEPLMGGDPNPMNPMLVLANDTSADELNYYGTGFSHSALVDLERRQIGVTGGTAYVMPAEAALFAYLANGTMNAQTGGLGYPTRTHIDWVRLFGNATTSAEQQSIYADFRQTQEDREDGLRLYLNTARYDSLMTDAFAVLDMDTGVVKWIKRRVATNSEASSIGYVISYGSFIDDEDYIKAQYLGASGDHDWDMAAVHVIGEYGPDFYSLGATDGSIQIFDPDTGATVSDTKVLTGQYKGSINSGGTIDDSGNVYFSGQWYRTFDYISDLNHITTFNATTSMIQVVQNPDCRLNFGSSLCTEGKSVEWYSDAFIDTFDDLGNGAGAIYINQDVSLPDSVGLLFKTPVPFAATSLAVTREPPSERNSGINPSNPPYLGESVLTSVNDVLIATSQYGNIQLWDATTMTPIRIIDLLPDVVGLPGHPGYLTCSNGVAIAGKELWFTCGGNFAEQGSGPGAFVYSYSV